jgi:menaquinone-9 beta-reductase
VRAVSSGGERADIVVVGAGPAGTATALLLARAGFDVLLVDRAHFPRPKACGECLSPLATRLLRQLGVLDRVLAERPARLAGWRMIAPSGARFEERFPVVHDAGGWSTEALAIERAALDLALLQAARETGVRWRAPFHVTGLLRAGTRICGVTGRDADGRRDRVTARFVVGADGLRSRVALGIGAVRRAPRRHKLSLSTHLWDISCDDGFGEMHLAAGACLGIAPLRADASELCNVTIVIEDGRHDRVPRRDRFDNALARFPAARARLAHALADASPAWLASGPFDRPTRHVTSPGCALVGDAAGYFDPFTGQGICHALLDANALAPRLAAAFHGAATERAALRAYASEHGWRTAEAHALQRGIDTIVRHAWLADRGIAAVARSRTFRSALLAATGDLVRPRALLSPPLLLTFLAENLLRRSA